MVPQNFAVLAKLGFCSKCSQDFSGRSFARARIFLQVLACSVFSGGSVLKMLADFVNARAPKGKRCARMLAKTIRYPLVYALRIFFIIL